MSRHMMPFFNRPDRFWDWDTQRLFESHFGSTLTDDDFFSPMPMTPSYYVRRRPFGRQISGSTSPGIVIPPPVRSLVPQPQDLVVQPDKFQVMVDVSHFTPEEITVKTVDNTVVVTAKHEDRADDFGYISRQFSRKYLLPPDVDPLTVSSALSAEGILTIQAPRKKPEIKDKDGGREVPIAITPVTPLPQPKQIPVENVQKESEAKPEEKK